MWPTWASILCKSESLYGREAYNFGQCGISNTAIMSNIAIADRVFNFTPEDKIIIVWTSLHRETRLFSYYCSESKATKWQWLGQGNIFGMRETAPKWVQEYITSDWSMEHDLITNYTVMSVTERAYKPAFQGHIYEPLEHGDIEFLGIDEGIVAWYNAYYAKNGKNLFNQRTTELWHGAPGMVHRLEDPHPDPSGHLQYLKDCVLPQTGIELHPDVFPAVVGYQTDMETLLGTLSKEELQANVQWQGQDWTLLNKTCIELLEKHDFERGADIKNYGWLFKQITPSTILNKII